MLIELYGDYTIPHKRDLTGNYKGHFARREEAKAGTIDLEHRAMRHESLESVPLIVM